MTERKESAAVKLESEEVLSSGSFDAYSFFGVRFRIGFDQQESRKIFRETYRHLQVVPPDGDECWLTFRVLSDSEKMMVVENAQTKQLVDVFRRGSNRYRFTVEEVASPQGFFGISDMFLSGKRVMTVSDRICRFRDNERWRAYAELVVFHTVLSEIPEYFALHAGAVSFENTGVILCGEANKGKTTLTLALVRHGFKFLTDEVVMIDLATGLAVPFPRSLGIRENTLGMFAEFRNDIPLQPTQSLSGDDKWLVDVNQLFPGKLGPSCKVNSVIFLEGFAASPELRPLKTSEALFKCIKYSHTAEADPFQSMMRIAQVIQNARCFALYSGTVEDTVRLVADVVVNGAQS